MATIGRPSKEGSARSYVDWAAKNTTRPIILDKLRGMHMRESCFPDIDVARHDVLKNRVKKLSKLARGGPGDLIVIIRGLVIVDSKNDIMLIYLPGAVPER